ncbi:MAG: hypothetical protein K6G11_03655 [Lachnospiraceae bacterium]|nr:hypothetical protein [Lachnospiraceae bacterium]
MITVKYNVEKLNNVEKTRLNEFVENYTENINEPLLWVRNTKSPMFQTGFKCDNYDVEACLREYVIEYFKELSKVVPRAQAEFTAPYGDEKWLYNDENYRVGEYKITLQNKKVETSILRDYLPLGRLTFDTSKLSEVEKHTFGNYLYTYRSSMKKTMYWLEQLKFPDFSAEISLKGESDLKKILWNLKSLFKEIGRVFPKVNASLVNEVNYTEIEMEIVKPKDFGEPLYKYNISLRNGMIFE